MRRFSACRHAKIIARHTHTLPPADQLFGGEQSHLKRCAAKDIQCTPTSSVSNNNCVVCHRRTPSPSTLHRHLRCGIDGASSTFCNCLIHHFAYLDLLWLCTWIKCTRESNCAFRDRTRQTDNQFINFIILWCVFAAAAAATAARIFVAADCCQDNDEGI